MYFTGALFAALLQQAKSQCSPIAGPLSEKSSVNSMQNSLVIVSGHEVWNHM